MQRERWSTEAISTVKEFAENGTPELQSPQLCKVLRTEDKVHDHPN